MTLRRFALVALAAVALGAGRLHGQTASLGAKQRQTEVGRIAEVPPREAPKVERNAIYDRYSWISVRPPKPRTYQVGDLMTIIVRERRRFEADSALETKKRFQVKSELDAFIKLTAGGLGAATFQRGSPTIDYKYDNRLKSEGDAEREDSLTMRLSGKILDVKPNGLLVLEAKARIEYDEEISTITLTGTCRKEDVTADNTILSTQIADKNIVVDNEGALRAASTRGWIPKLIDLLNPI